MSQNEGVKVVCRPGHLKLRLRDSIAWIVFRNMEWGHVHRADGVW